MKGGGLSPLLAGIFVMGDTGEKGTMSKTSVDRPRTGMLLAWWEMGVKVQRSFMNLISS